MNGGDGDQSILSAGIVMRLTETEWYPGHVGEFGEALLFQIENPPFAGEFVALTSHVVMRLKNQFAEHGLASTVVHCVQNPLADMRSGWKGRVGIGMAIVSRIPDADP